VSVTRTMAEEAKSPVSVGATNTTEEVTRSTDAVAQPAVAEAKSAEDGVEATSGIAEGKRLFVVYRQIGC
jgi:hypothetical protein